MVRLADDDPRPGRDPWRLLDEAPRVVRRLEVAARFVGAPLLAPAGHAVQAYTNVGMVLHLGASVSRWLFVYGRSGHSPAVEESTLDVEAAREAMLELDHALHRLQGGPVLLTAKDGEHTRMVVGGGNRGT